eukprot:scaffold443_cov527-Prasinococcus_capsulatus_cf.AAC.20
MGCLDLPRHVRELVADHPVLNEFLAEGPPSMGVLECFLKAYACESVGLGGYSEPFRVEIVHDVLTPAPQISVARASKGLTLDKQVKSIP